MFNLDDSEIIQRVKAGNAHAFSILIDRHKMQVYNLAVQMLKNREEAEETAQDVFVKVFKSLDTFKGDAKFPTWLYRVTYNACLDRLKKLNRERTAVKIADQNIHSVAHLDDALDALEKEDRHKAVDACLKELPGEENALLMMFYYEEKSLEEIASIVNLKPTHVKVKLFRLRKKMESLLSKRLEALIIS